MKKSYLKKFLILVCVVVISGCANKIGIKNDYDQVSFEINKTTKGEVIDHFGLPQKVLKDDEGREHYFYEKGARLVGLCVACGNTSASPGLIPALISEANLKNGAEYVFDANGLLVAEFYAGKK